MGLSRGMENHRSRWCQQFRHSWMWHLTERETKQGMLANTLAIKGTYFVFSGISHRLTQNLLHLLFTVIHQGVLCLHVVALGYLWAECFVQMVRVDHMLPTSVGVFLWESSYWSSDTQGHGILFPFAGDTWKALKIQMSKLTDFTVEKNSLRKVIKRILSL